jgi:hypothetical protein
MKKIEIDAVTEQTLKMVVAPSSEHNMTGLDPTGKRLKATWKGIWEPGDEPFDVSWEDGRAATLGDFHTHELDTRFCREDGEGQMSQYMYPDIVAEVHFDHDANDWIVRGHDVVTTSLDIADSNASDSDLIAALCTLETVYRSKIIR